MMGVCMVQVQPTATGARNYSQCDSMLIGDTASANTYPYIQVSQYTQQLQACTVQWSTFVCIQVPPGKERSLPC